MESLEEMQAEIYRLKAENKALRDPIPECRSCREAGRRVPSTRLCDFRIARCIATMEELTCSAPMCESASCGVRVDGPIFFCGGDDGCEVDWTDYCISHRAGNYGVFTGKLVTRGELYEMEKAGRGIILVKSKGPMLVAR